MGVSRVFLNDAGLNKGPPANTNTGSRSLSLTGSFIFLGQSKQSKTSEDYLAENPLTQKCGTFKLNSNRWELLTLLMLHHLAFLKVHNIPYSFDRWQFDYNANEVFVSWNIQACFCEPGRHRRQKTVSANKWNIQLIFYYSTKWLKLSFLASKSCCWEPQVYLLWRLWKKRLIIHGDTGCINECKLGLTSTCVG